MSDSKLLGPVQIYAKVHCVHPETGNTAVVTYGLSPGQVVSPEDIEIALRKSANAIAEQGYVLMGPNTFFNHVLVKEKTGRVGHFALPSSFDFDAFGLKVAEADSSRNDVDEDEEDEDDL